jgi:hypothetical protein
LEFLPLGLVAGDFIVLVARDSSRKQTHKGSTGNCSKYAKAAAMKRSDCTGPGVTLATPFADRFGACRRGITAAGWFGMPWPTRRWSSNSSRVAQRYDEMHLWVFQCPVTQWLTSNCLPRSF